jgi:signal transduction histidine kinase
MRRSLRALSEPMLARARQRLSAVSLLLGLAFLAINLTATGWWLWGGSTVSSRYALQVDLISAGLWLLLSALARSRRLSHVAVLQLGQVFFVLICGVLSSLTAINTYRHGYGAPILSWVPFLIAMVPLLVPTPPRRTLLIVSLAAASAPIGVAIAYLVGESPLPGDLLAVSVGPVAAAVIAMVGSGLIYATSVDLAELRDQAARVSAVAAALGDAVVLRDHEGDVVFMNPAARDLLGERLDRAPAPLQRALDLRQHGAVVGRVDGRAETFHVSSRELRLLDEPHEIMLIRRLTPHIDQADVASWRKLVRALSHELGNTVGPMSSFLHSLRLLIERGAPASELCSAVDSLQERVDHLADFLSEYASLARLPAPRPRPVAWRGFLDSLRPFAPFRLREPLPDAPGHFDPGQIEHVLLNLWRNAVQAGSPEDAIELAVAARAGGFEIQVLDRGHGLTAETAERALLPFFSTRPGGTGLGLALSREIATAHGGWIAIAARDDGGAVVSMWLPSSEAAPADLLR